MTDFGLAGRRALVTGANTGIGQAIAVALGQAGAHVICAGRSSCAETVGMIETAEELHLDFSDPMAAEHVFDDGPIDILVNNAGGSRAGKGVKDNI